MLIRAFMLTLIALEKAQKLMFSSLKDLYYVSHVMQQNNSNSNSINNKRRPSAIEDHHPRTLNLDLASNFLTALMSAFSKSIALSMNKYLSQVEDVETSVTKYQASKVKYEHYVVKLSSIGKKAAEEDDLSSSKITKKLSRNNEKLRHATLKFDKQEFHITQTLSAVTSAKGIESSLNPIVDRVMQFFGLLGGFYYLKAVEQQKQFCRTRGTLANDGASDSSASDDDDEDFAADDFNYEEDFDDDFDKTTNATPDLTKRNYLLPYKPRYSSLVKFLDLENPKHFAGVLSIKRAKKMFSSKHYCVLRGNKLNGYLSENEAFFGVEPIFEYVVGSVTEWESKAPYGFIITDRALGEDIFLKTDGGDEEVAHVWLKSLLLATTWDGPQAAYLFRKTLDEIKGIGIGKAEVETTEEMNEPTTKLPTPPTPEAALNNSQQRRSSNPFQDDDDEDLPSLPPKPATSSIPFKESPKKPAAKSRIFGGGWGGGEKEIEIQKEQQEETQTIVDVEEAPPQQPDPPPTLEEEKTVGVEEAPPQQPDPPPPPKKKKKNHPHLKF